MPVVTNEVTPSSPSDTYPVAREIHIKGGLNSSFSAVGDWVSTTNLPMAKRTAGMLVSAGSVSPNDIYVLQSDMVTFLPLATAVGAVRSFDTVADLTTFASSVNTTTAPKLVRVRGYWSTHPGVGGAFWRLDTSSTRAVGVGCKQVGASGAGRYIVVFENGRIDVTQLGARAAAIDDSRNTIETFTTDTNAAFQAAAALQQEEAWPDKIIYVPASAGVYQISQTIAPAANPIRVAFNIHGQAASIGFEEQRNRGASTIRMMTNNTPIIEIGGENGSLKDLSLEYNSTQPSSNTNANAVVARSTARVFYWLFYNIQIARAARGFYFPTGSALVTSNNNTFDEIRVTWFSISGIEILRSGTVNKAGRWYIQNNSFDANQNVSITNVTKSGAELTLTVSALASNLTVGSLVEVTGLQSFNGSTRHPMFVKNITGLNVKADLPSDPGGTITDTSGNMEYNCNQASTQPPVVIGENFELDITSLDIEVNAGTTATNAALALDTAGMLNIGYLHLEYMQPNGTTQTFIRNRGTLNIGVVGIVNISLPSTRTAYLVTNERINTFEPYCKIDAIDARDIANLGGAFFWARSISSAAKVIIGDRVVTQSYRANATGDWPVGDAVTFLKVSSATQNAALGGTGLLEVVSGALQTPRPLPTVIAANQALAREALGLGTPVGTMTGRYGGLDGYTSIDEGTTVSTHRILRTCTDLQLAYSNLIQPDPYPTSPASIEVGANPFELIVSIVKVSSDFTTEIGSPVHLRFQGSNRYWHLMGAAGIHLTEPARMLFTAGDYVRVYTYCNLIQSDSTTITTNGVAEVGQLTATSTEWPLNGVYGGTLVTDGINGVLANTGGVITPATYNRTNGTSGGAIGITTPYGYGPCFIIGRPLDSGSALSTNAGICLIGDSILNNSIDLPRVDEAVGSGNGYFMRAVGHTRPVFRAATGGQRAQHLVGDFAYNLTHRGLGVGRCQVAYVALGTNDLFNGRTASELQADLTTLFAMLRSVGYVKIITGSITPRTSSTDGWQTAANQTQVQVGFDTKAIAVNAWLASQVGVLTNGHLDFTAAVTQNDGTLRWKNSTGATNYTVNGTPSTTSVPVSTALTASAWINYSLLSGTATRRITANTTSGFTVEPAYGAAPLVGATVTRLRCMVDGSDNVHPTAFGHIDMAAVVTANISLFNL